MTCWVSKGPAALWRVFEGRALNRIPYRPFSSTKNGRAQRGRARMLRRLPPLCEPDDAAVHGGGLIAAVDDPLREHGLRNIRRFGELHAARGEV